MFMRRFPVFVLASMLAATPSAVLAQEEQDVPQANATEVENENLAYDEAFGDWQVRCFKVESPAPCDVMQLAISQDTQQRVLSVSIAFVPSRGTYGMQMVVPLGVSLAKGVTLAAGDNSLTGVKYSRCELNGCYIELLAPEETLNALAGMEKTTLEIWGYDATEASQIPLSLTGFSDAMTEMKAQSRRRAVEPPQQ
jgi:invasion protein IalB